MKSSFFATITASFIALGLILSATVWAQPGGTIFGPGGSGPSPLPGGPSGAPPTGAPPTGGAAGGVTPPTGGPGGLPSGGVSFDPDSQTAQQFEQAIENANNPPPQDEQSPTQKPPPSEEDCMYDFGPAGDTYELPFDLGRLWLESLAGSTLGGGGSFGHAVQETQIRYDICLITTTTSRTYLTFEGGYYFGDRCSGWYGAGGIGLDH